MSLAAERVKEYLDLKTIRYEHFEKTEERRELIKVGFNAKNAEVIRLYFFFDDNGNSINVKSFSVAKVSESKLGAILTTLNELNSEYRWVKFYVDSEKEVTVSGDAIISPETAGEECFEILVRYVDIIDEVYPRIMKALWG